MKSVGAVINRCFVRRLVWITPQYLCVVRGMTSQMFCDVSEHFVLLTYTGVIIIESAELKSLYCSLLIIKEQNISKYVLRSVINPHIYTNRTHLTDSIDYLLHPGHISLFYQPLTLLLCAFIK